MGEKKVQTIPCYFKGVKIFAGKPGIHFGSVKAQIKGLFYSSSDKVNKGKCVVDYQSRYYDEVPPHPGAGNLIDPAVVRIGSPDTEKPAGPYEPYAPAPATKCVEKSKQELCLKKNQLIRVLPVIGREYTITFDLYLYSYSPEEWSSVLHFTTSGNNHNYGDRNPAIWVYGQHEGKTYNQIVVHSGVSGMKNLHIHSEKTYPLKTWIPIKISQISQFGFTFNFQVEIDGELVLRTENNLPVELSDVKVFGGNPWYPAQEGKIRNLDLDTKKDGMCLCQFKESFCNRKAGSGGFCKTADDCDQKNCFDCYYECEKNKCVSKGLHWIRKRIVDPGDYCETEDDCDQENCADCGYKCEKNKCVSFPVGPLVGTGKAGSGGYCKTEDDCDQENCADCGYKCEKNKCVAFPVGPLVGTGKD